VNYIITRFSDSTIYFKDIKKNIIISLTPIAMDGSIKCKIFPISTENNIDNLEFSIYEDYIEASEYEEAYFGELHSLCYALLFNFLMFSILFNKTLIVTLIVYDCSIFI